MSEHDQTILDSLLSNHRFSCQRLPAKANGDELVHVFGAQEPVRMQPDERARSLLQLGWLHIEYIDTSVPLDKRGELVATIQQRAQDWLKQAKGESEKVRQQVRWLVEKTRAAESPQQIAQRVWLAAVLYNLGMRGLTFDAAGQILYEGGQTARVGLAPDSALELIWDKPQPVLYAASFRQADGVIWRGKGRQRWHVYCLTLAPQARILFERRQRVTKEKVALIVASETYARRPQLPRDFYGGDAFQQACIDAQDQQFNHILVLSPKHGVLSLDDVVSSDESWDHVARSMPWVWAQRAMQRLGLYLYGTPPAEVSDPHKVNWWAWLSPQSSYELTTFGSGFPVQMLISQVNFILSRFPKEMPRLNFSAPRPGYKAIEIEEFGDFGFFEEPESDADLMMDELEELLGWAAELSEHIVVSFPPTGDEWTLAPEEAIIPARLLALNTQGIEDVLDLLSDLSLTLEHAVPCSLILNARSLVETLLQIAHAVVHDDQEDLQESLEILYEPLLSHYVETVLQEPKQEDRLCGILSVIESLHLLSMMISDALNEQLMVWLQTYLASHLHQRLSNGFGWNNNQP